MSQHTETFTFSGLITFDGLQRECEVDPEPCRVHYELHPNGQVTPVRLEWNCARAGQPAYWVPFDRMLKGLLEKEIEDDMAEEERNTEMLEQERMWETGT